MFKRFQANRLTLSLQLFVNIRLFKCLFSIGAYFKSLGSYFVKRSSCNLFFSQHRERVLSRIFANTPNRRPLWCQNRYCGPYFRSYIRRNPFLISYWRCGTSGWRILFRHPARVGRTRYLHWTPSGISKFHGEYRGFHHGLLGVLWGYLPRFAHPDAWKRIHCRYVRKRVRLLRYEFPDRRYEWWHSSDGDVQ